MSPLDPGWDDIVYVEPAPKRSRGRRTDFCRPGRLRFFGNGRSIPTKALTVGIPVIYQFAICQDLGIGYVIAMDIPRGTVWVTV